MVEVETILVRFKTRDMDDAGTDGDVYLGIGGREFYIDSSRDDFERGDDRTYILGDAPTQPPPNSTTVLYKFFNDPQKPYGLRTENLNLFPVYVRIESGGLWILDLVEVSVNPEAEQIKYSALVDDSQFLWLGRRAGRALYLLPEPPIIL